MYKQLYCTFTILRANYGGRVIFIMYSTTSALCRLARSTEWGRGRIGHTYSCTVYVHLIMGERALNDGYITIVRILNMLYTVQLISSQNRLLFCTQRHFTRQYYDNERRKVNVAVVESHQNSFWRGGIYPHVSDIDQTLLRTGFWVSLSDDKPAFLLGLS